MCASLARLGTASAEPGEALTVSLLTMGPGEHPFTKFGHTALWVHDAADARDEVYNFGTFAFDSPTLLLDSVQGKLPYWLSVQSLTGTIAAYREQDRSLVASELLLTPAERWELYRALRDNARPEHRYYRYEYYRDNCSTRIRDALDRVLGGRLSKNAHQPVALSYRDHTLRLVAGDGLLYAALDLALGREADAPIDRWDEGFLPEKLHELALHTTVLWGSAERPLVARERTLVAADHAPAPSLPPAWGGRYLLAGLVAGALFASLGAVGKTHARARKALGAALLSWGLGVGLLGLALTYLTIFSAHAAAHANVNALLFPPWAFGLAAAGFGIFRGNSRRFGLARWTSLALLGSTLLSLLVNRLGRDAQVNYRELAFAAPLWLGVAAAVFLASRGRAPSTS